MKRIALIAVGCSLLACGLAVADTISVTKPAANDVWLKGSSHTVQWVPQGPPTVSITLIDPADTTSVQVISNSAPNSGSFQWPSVPAAR